jgi:hypothetical protein
MAQFRMILKNQVSVGVSVGYRLGVGWYRCLVNYVAGLRYKCGNGHNLATMYRHSDTIPTPNRHLNRHLEKLYIPTVIGHFYPNRHQIVKKIFSAKGKIKLLYRGWQAKKRLCLKN